MEIGEKFLPIGTVVLLKNGKRELMITSYCIMPSGHVYDKNGEVDVKGQVFDYGACYYPEGMIRSDQLFAFNHEQIERVCFKGYETDNQKELSKVLNSESAKLKEEINNAKNTENNENIVDGSSESAE